MADLGLCVLDGADVAAVPSRSHTQLRRLLAFDRLDRLGVRKAIYLVDCYICAFGKPAHRGTYTQVPGNLYDDMLRSTKAFLSICHLCSQSDRCCNGSIRVASRLPHWPEKVGSQPHKCSFPQGMTLIVDPETVWRLSHRIPSQLL